MTALVARLVADRRVRYLGAGGLGAVVYYGLFAAGWFTLAHVLPYLVVSVLASTLTAILTYPVYRIVVFRTGGGWISGFLKFYVVCLWGLTFAIGGLWVLVELAGLHPLVGQAIVIVLGPLINYQAGRLWAFRPPPARTPDQDPADALSGSHQDRLSRYQATASASPAAKSTRGA